MSELYHLEEWKIARDPSDPRHVLPPPAAPGTRVLDVGCGAGQSLAAVCGAGSGVGVDPDLEALALGARLAPGVRFVQGRAEALPFRDGSFDFAMARLSLPYAHIPTALREMRRVLRPGGGLWLALHRWKIPREFARSGGWRARAAFARIAVDSFALHLVGKQRRAETFQTEAGMRRALAAAGFTDVEMPAGRHFVATARAR